MRERERRSEKEGARRREEEEGGGGGRKKKIERNRGSGRPREGERVSSMENWVGLVQGEEQF